MDLKDILAISGQGGLFKYVSDGRNGIIVESLIDKKRMFVSASTKISSLKDISIYTETKELALSDVLKNIYNKESGGAAIDPKSTNDDLKNYMEKVLPDYDKDRVYVSDIKKLVSWYSILREQNMLIFEEETTEQETPPEEKVGVAVENEKKKPLKNTVKKPATPYKKPTSAKLTTARNKPKAAK